MELSYWEGLMDLKKIFDKCRGFKKETVEERLDRLEKNDGSILECIMMLQQQITILAGHIDKMRGNK